MKTNLIVKSTLALVLAIGIAAPFALAGTPQTKGAQQLLWTPKTPAPAVQARATDCPTGMACAKCKNVPARAVIAQKGQVQSQIVSTKHLCNNCVTTSKTVGSGKAAKTVFEHTCADSGTATASCCN
jgi:hypothetical protein